MSKNSIAMALGVCALMLLTVAAPAQRHRAARHSRSSAKKTVHASVSGAETGLAGIKLYDNGSRIVAVYGSPDSIEAVTFGGTTAGPGGGAAGGGRMGNPGMVGGGGGTRGGGGGGGAVGAQSDRPGGPSDFDFGNGFLMPTPGFQKPSFGGPPGGVPQGPPGGQPGPSMAGASGPGGGGGAMGGMNGGSSDRIVFTRWVYNRNASKYGFILDKYNRVVQCEAIGIQSGKARTRRGITFGSSFAQIIKKYGAPDGYEIAGDNVVVRYLSKDKCAFRLSRLGENKPDVVTGIVVAAGKR